MTQMHLQVLLTPPVICSIDFVAIESGALGYKNHRPKFSFLQAGSHSYIFKLEFRVDRQIYISLLTMVHIKLSVVFILAAAAIRPVVPLPTPNFGNRQLSSQTDVTNLK